MLRPYFVILLLFSLFALSQQTCQDNNACNYAYEEDCVYPQVYYDCNGVCLSDLDSDNICDELEVMGCTDGVFDDGTPMACNYNPFATEDNGSCVYPGLIFDCDGSTCLNDIDGDGVCDEFEIDGCNDIDAFNYNSGATDDDGSCWYPIYGCLDPFAGNYNPYAELNDESCLYSPWEYSSTDCNMTVLIPVDVNISIDSESLLYGDWIGAFYENQFGDLVCGGSVMWKEETTSIALWGAENNQNNGFLENQNITWKTISNNEERILIPTYSFGENNYSCNGLGALDDLTIFSQHISLPPGWSIFSSYINPIDSSLEKIFELTDDVIIIKNEMGDVFWPSLSIDQIGYLSFDEGYIIKMDYYGNGFDLVLEGELIPSDTELTFQEGWSIIPYLNTQPMLVDEVLSSIEDQLIIIKDEDGLIWWPSFGVNSMDLMYPGNGYQIKMIQEVNFSYQSNIYSRLYSSNKTNYFTYFSPANKTDHNMTIGIPKYSWIDYVPAIGDEIAVFNSSGILVGSQVFEGENIAITVWGDDTQTMENDGMFYSEPFYLKLWSTSLNKEFDLYIENLYEGNKFYTSNGISVVNAISLKTTQEPNNLIYHIDILGRVINPLHNEYIGFDIYDDGSVNRRF